MPGGFKVSSSLLVICCGPVRVTWCRFLPHKRHVDVALQIAEPGAPYVYWEPGLWLWGWTWDPLPCPSLSPD